jgi:hypothetical protein
LKNPFSFFLLFFFQEIFSNFFRRGCRFFKISGLNANEVKVIGLAEEKKLEEGAELSTGKVDSGIAGQWTEDFSRRRL